MMLAPLSKIVILVTGLCGLVLLAKRTLHNQRLLDWEATLASGIPHEWAAKCSDGESEMVYALMITGKSPARAWLAQRSYEDFERQTHPSKALVMVVGDGFDIITSNPCVLKLRVDEQESIHLGQLRNVALLGVPKDGVWVQWDDDDCHHPELMAQQLAQMQQHGAPGCLLQAQIRFYVQANVTSYIRNPNGGIMGTVMSRKLEGVRYPNKAKGEDAPMAYAVRRRKAVFWDNPPGLYVRVIHGHNTWDAKKFGGLINPNGYEHNTWDIQPEDAKSVLMSCGTLAGGSATFAGLQGAMGGEAGAADARLTP